MYKGFKLVDSVKTELIFSGESGVSDDLVDVLEIMTEVEIA